jgi:ligand-binding SRPBCC domain-containing protein
MGHLQKSKIIPFSVPEVFSYVSNFRNLPFMLEPYIDVDVLTSPVMRKGADFAFKMTRLGIARKCIFRIDDYRHNEMFSDRQIEGVFARWHHVQRLEVRGNEQTLLTDYVDYTLPMGFLGRLADDLISRFDLAEIMEHRQERIIEALAKKKREDKSLNT